MVIQYSFVCGEKLRIACGEKWKIACGEERGFGGSLQSVLQQIMILLIKFPAEAQKRISHCNTRDQIINLASKPQERINPLNCLVVVR